MKRPALSIEAAFPHEIPDPRFFDPELQIVNHITRAVNTSGLRVDPVSITNLYVSLKSKPMTLIVGHDNSGKIAALKNIVGTLLGSDPLRCQMMVGHPWWANQSDDILRFTEAQAIWNSSKIIELIQEARLPENNQRMYIACLLRISPAELSEVFSGIAFQLQRNGVIRVSSMHLSEPIYFPRNMFLVGTMDADHFRWMDEDLLSKTSLIHWAPDDSQVMNLATDEDTIWNPEKVFLRSCLRSMQMALQKLYWLLKSHREAFSPLFQTSRILQKYKIIVHSSMIQSAMIYLANSWTQKGTGLFDRNTSKNLDIALDIAIAQSVLMPIENKLKDSAILRNNLRDIYRNRFTRSSGLVLSS